MRGRSILGYGTRVDAWIPGRRHREGRFVDVLVVRQLFLLPVGTRDRLRRGRRRARLGGGQPLLENAAFLRQQSTLGLESGFPRSDVQPATALRVGGRHVSANVLAVPAFVGSLVFFDFLGGNDGRCEVVDQTDERHNDQPNDPTGNGDLRGGCCRSTAKSLRMKSTDASDATIIPDVCDIARSSATDLFNNTRGRAND